MKFDVDNDQYAWIIHGLDELSYVVFYTVEGRANTHYNDDIVAWMENHAAEDYNPEFLIGAVPNVAYFAQRYNLDQIWLEIGWDDPVIAEHGEGLEHIWQEHGQEDTGNIDFTEWGIDSYGELAQTVLDFIQGGDIVLAPGYNDRFIITWGSQQMMVTINLEYGYIISAWPLTS